MCRIGQGRAGRGLGNGAEPEGRCSAAKIRCDRRVGDGIAGTKSGQSVSLGEGSEDDDVGKGSKQVDAVDIAGREDASNGDIEVALDLVMRRTNPNAQVLCSGRLEHSLHGLTKVTVLVTGLSFPYSWGGYRRLPLGIYELEPEAGADEEIKVELDLHQLEDFAAQRIL